MPSASEFERDEIREQVFAAFGELTKDNRSQHVVLQFFEMVIDANPKLVQVFHRQCWNRLPNKVREKVLEKQIEVSEADFRKHLDRINFRRARALYEPTALRKRFKRWVEFVQVCEHAWTLHDVSDSVAGLALFLARWVAHPHAHTNRMHNENGWRSGTGRNDGRRNACGGSGIGWRTSEPTELG